MTVSDQGMNCRRRQSHAGFTLLELLISISLLGFILVLLYTVQQRVDNLNTVRAVESFLRREMEMTYPYRWKGTPEQRMAFLGERNKVSFVAQLPSRIGTGGLYLASLELERSSKGRRLVWRYMPVTGQLHDFSVLDQAQEMVLAGTELGTVDDIWLSYLGPEGEKG